MKTTFKLSAFVLAIAMAAALNNIELNAQVRSSAGRSGQARVQQDNRSAAHRDNGQVNKDNGQAHRDNGQVRQNNGQVHQGGGQVHQGGGQVYQGGGQISSKDKAKMDKKQGKVDHQQMPAGRDRQPDLNHQVDMARQNHQLQVPFRPERRDRIGHGPVMAPVPVFTPAQVKLRTNATTLVVYTDFFTKAQAYAYVSNLLADMYYDIDTYDTSYGWFNTSMTVIPTPTGWADPRAANQFRIRFDFKRSGGRIKVYITAQWRESMLGGPLYNLRYQPSDRYSTYYAWNILEQIATSIPNYRIDFL